MSETEQPHGTEQPHDGDEITPDTRDWAEVLVTGCRECGFTGDEDVDSAADVVRESASAWQTVLESADADRRPRPERWSALEYAAHVRDILDLFDGRTRLMLAETDPELPNFDGDAVARDSDYRHQDPTAVLAGLIAAAGAYASTLDALDGEQWERAGHRADGRPFTVSSLTRYGLHELRHHLGDVGAPVART